MDQIAKLYYNKAISLQEQYDFLNTIVCLLETSEADKILDMMMGYGGRIKPHSFAALSKEEQEILRRATEELKAKEAAKEAAKKMSPEERASLSKKPISTAETTDKPSSKPKPSTKRKPASASTPKSSSDSTPKPSSKRKPTSTPKPTIAEPPSVQKPPTTQPTPKISTGQKVTNIAKGLGRGAAGFGTGMLGYEVGRGISDTAMDVVGVENQTARDIAGEALGGAGFGTASAATTTALSGGGLIGLKAAGAAAGTGALAGLAAYGGYKAGEAISNIEVDKKTGKQVSDVLGSIAYKTPIVKMATNLIAGNKLLADTADLYEKPKGVAGGDPTKIAQNIAGEEEEEAQKKAEMEERIARAASRRKGM